MCCGETTLHGVAYYNAPRMVELLPSRGAGVAVYHHQNYYGWTPLRIAEGFRRGNFKPSPPTISAGLTPPPPSARNKGNNDDYAAAAKKSP